MKRKLKQMPNMPRKKSRGMFPANKPGVTRTTGFYGRYNAGALKPEKKFLDTRVTAKAITGGNLITSDSLIKIAGGTGQSERVGRIVRVKGIHVRGFALRNSTVGTDGIRVIVYLDTQCNGAAALTTDLFVADDANSVPGYNSYLNLVNSRRFRILRDQKISSSANFKLSADYGNDFHHFDFNISTSLDVEYSTNGSAITDIKSNNIGIAVLSFQKTSVPIVYYVARARYEDV